MPELHAATPAHPPELGGVVVGFAVVVGVVVVGFGVVVVVGLTVVVVGLGVVVGGGDPPYAQDTPLTRPSPRSPMSAWKAAGVKSKSFPVQPVQRSVIVALIERP
jgi:hypothetical protein